MPPPAPEAFNHVAISVPSIDEAAAWYNKIFGFRRICADGSLDRSDAPDALAFKIYGDTLQKVKMAWLTCGNGVGFEIFEFIDPPYARPERAFDYARGGFFHICVTVADPDATAARAVESGARRIGETIEMKGQKALYLQDPWGNTVECLSCSFQQLLGDPEYVKSNPDG